MTLRRSITLRHNITLKHLVLIVVAGLLSVGLSVVATPRAHSANEISTCRFSIAQIHDVQWSILGFAPDATFSYYSAIAPKASVAPTGSLTGVDPLDTFAFFPSTTTPGTFGLKQMDREGNLIRIVHDWGTFRAAGDSMLFYVGGGEFGTLFTTADAVQIGGSGNYQVTQENLTNPEAAAFTSCSTEPVLLPGTPSLTITSITSDPAEVAEPGPVTFSYVVKNTGTADLERVTVTDTVAGITVTCPTDIIAPGVSLTCTGVYDVTQDDIDTSYYVRAGGNATAAVVGDDVDTSAPYSYANTPIALNPELTVTPVAANDMLTSGTSTLEFTLTNSGNMTLLGLSMETTSATIDPAGPSPLELPAFTCLTDTLAPTETTTCSGTFASPTAGDVTVAVSSRWYIQLEGTDVATAEVSFTVNEPTPVLVMTKTVSPKTAAAGELVTFTYTVANTGTDAADPLTITDDLPGMSQILCPNDAIPAGETMSCTATYTVTGADVAAGTLTSTATARGGWGELDVTSEGVVMSITLEAAPDPTPSPSATPSASASPTASPSSSASPTATPANKALANTGGLSRNDIAFAVGLGVFGILLIIAGRFIRIEKD